MHGSGWVEDLGDGQMAEGVGLCGAGMILGLGLEIRGVGKSFKGVVVGLHASRKSVERESI